MRNITELDEDVISSTHSCESDFAYIMYSNKVPQRNEIFGGGYGVYKVVAINDVTDDDEKDEGLSYSRVEFEKLSNFEIVDMFMHDN